MDRHPVSSLRSRRLECGLTQAQLAQRAGVSRQLVAAVEAGQNVPAVDAALRLARALAISVERLFPPASSAFVPALAEPLRDRALVRVGRVGGQMIAAELADHGTNAGGWGMADGWIDGRVLRLFAGTSVDRLLLAGCDPALGIAETMLAGLGPASILALPAPTDTALHSLREGRVHAAAVHGPAHQLPDAPVPVTRLQLASWQVGLAHPLDEVGITLEAILERDVEIVQRDSAAASQQALNRAATQLGVEVPAGPRAAGHIDAARQARIRHCAGITTEAAAHAFGLSFVPLEPHTVQIWIAEQWAQHQGVESLGSLLTSSAFTERVAALGGYDLAETGSLVSAN